jgi:hypothetical protein
MSCSPQAYVTNKKASYVRLVPEWRHQNFRTYVVIKPVDMNVPSGFDSVIVN